MALTLRLLGGLTTDGDRARLPGARADVAQRIVRAKRTPRRGRACRSRCRAAPSWASALAVGARGDLPDLQRGLLGHRRRRLDAPRAVRRGAAPGPDAGRAGARGARGARPRGADGDPGLAPARAGRAAGPSRSCCSTRTAARWDQLLIRRGLAALERAEALGGARGPYALQAAIAACHARARRPPATPTGAHRRALRRLAGSAPHRRSSSSTAPSRSAMADGPAAGWRSSTRWPASRRCAATTCCRAVRGDLLAKLRRRARGARRASSAPPASRPTHVSRLCCANGSRACAG